MAPSIFKGVSFGKASPASAWCYNTNIEALYKKKQAVGGGAGSCCSCAFVCVFVSAAASCPLVAKGLV